MEKEYKISWLKVIGIFVLIVVLIGVLFIIYPNNKRNTTVSNFASNISLMKEAGFDYFDESKLPEEVGDKEVVSLGDLIKEDFIEEFVDQNGESCNTEESYIETTKTVDNKYEMKVYLSCEGTKDYIVTTISDGVVCTDCDTESNETALTSNETRSTTNTVYSKKLNDYVRTPVSTNKVTTTNKTPTNKTSNKTTTETVTTKTYTTVTNIINYNINYFNSCGYCVSNNCMSSCLSNVYYTVHFVDGGDYVGKQTVKQYDTATYISRFRSGYEFLGWYLNGEKYDFSTSVTKSITLVAKWKKIEVEPVVNTYIVTFNSNGGTYVDYQEVEEYDRAFKPKDPTKDCYDFAGWYTDKSLTKKYSFSTPVTKDITLYAKWIENNSCVVEENKYTVSFNSNGGTKVNSQTVLEYDLAYEPKDPTRYGYTFAGWYTTSSLRVKYNFNTPVTKDITLYAKWQKNEVKYNTYCKVEEETYYSISYTTHRDNGGSYSYNWTIKFDKLHNVDNLRITDVGYLTSSTYNKAYNKYVADSGISKVNGNTNYNVPLKSASVLRNYSLKSNNFTKTLSNAYYSGGYWYTNASVTVWNYNNASEYYADNLGYYIYIVPFYFNISYTDMDNCVNDKAANSARYNSYEIVDTYYE